MHIGDEPMALAEAWSDSAQRWILKTLKGNAKGIGGRPDPEIRERCERDASKMENDELQKETKGREGGRDENKGEKKRKKRWRGKRKEKE